MTINYTIRTGIDTEKEVDLEPKYDSPSEWMDQDYDRDLVEDAFDAYCREFPDSGYVLRNDTYEFIAERNLYADYLEVWRKDEDVEKWFDNHLNEKWIDWEVSQRR